MARIADEVIERIKAEVSLERLVEGFGVELKKHGKDKVGRCPFHDDRTPSLVVSPSTNLWHCLGACGTGGSVIDWVIKTQGVSFRHAVELLRDDVSVLAADHPVSGSVPVKHRTVPKLENPLSLDTADQAVLDQVSDFYHQTLLESPEAQDYLKKRGLDDPALIRAFKLGHANRTLGLRLPAKNRKAGAQLREQLQHIGLYRDTGREHFNGSLVIPVMDKQGRVTEVYGRKLLDNLRKGTPKHLYLPGPHRGVFNLSGLENTEEVILCESLIDALTFYRWGFTHATSSYGTNGFTDEILQAFIEHKIQRVLIAYDRDAAGDKAATEVAKKLQSHGLGCFRIQFPKSMDANEYAKQMQPPQKALALVIRQAEWMGKGNDKSRPAITSAATVPEVEKVEREKVEGEKVEKNTRSAQTPAEVPALAANPEPAASADSEPPAEEQIELDLAASPVPSLSRTDTEISGSEKALFITLGDRVYRVRGLDKNPAGELKIQLLAKRNDHFHMDKLDLTSAKQRQVFINQASLELGVKDEVIKKDLGKVLLALEEQQHRQQQPETTPTTELNDREREEALALLQDKDLLNRILNDFNRAGVVGEETNKLTGYLACVSRKLERPLAVIIQSSSAAGKSSLMESILALMPEDERVQYSAMTGQSLFYMGETNLKHKILAIAEEEGAANASYALKLLQSEGEVTIASTGKDDNTGQLVTREYRVEGPVMLFLTTTAIDIDEELMNRCLVLSVNEGREQTRAIHQAQRARRTLHGLQHKLEKTRILQLHRNAQRLLKPLAVINPYADQLTFLDDKTRTRRDHEKYLTLIDSIALLHQQQRPIKSIEYQGQQLDYVEVTLADIETANRLASEVLGRTLDELPPQTRKLLKAIQGMVQQECQAQRIEQRDYRFSRKHIRDFTQWSDGQLKIHCKRLEEMEYLLVHRGGRGQSLEYELLYSGNGDSNRPQLMGLLDTERLRKTSSYDAEKSGQKVQKAGPSQAQVSPKSGPVKSAKSRVGGASAQSSQGNVKSALQAV
ncbi:CHC2 zinc finger domain-containing protein [Microbulbifer sp. VAAC004]|uniref:CHC2 zinc finger domain-containing protein n=1 Tax=unclassified Microbulbifer TaxID=2619833 RepID=UPI00403A4659